MKEEFDALFAEHQKLLGELQAMRALAGAECDRQPEQEPVAFDVQKALRRAYHLGQSYWADADSESYAANKRSDKHRQNFDELCEEALAYTTPPQRTTEQPRQWVGLSREDCYQVRERESDAFMYGVAWAEAKLKEKNT